MLRIAKDLVGKLSLLCSLETAIIEKMEQLEKEQYKIREDYKRCTKVNRDLESRYTELVYAFNATKALVPEDIKERIAQIEYQLSKKGTDIPEGNC